MIKKFSLPVAFLAVVFLVVLSLHGGKAVGDNVSLTLYNSAGIGVVERTMEIELGEGINEVPLGDFGGIDLAEASLRPLDDDVSVLGLFGGERRIGNDVEVGLKSGEKISGKYLGIRDGKLAVEGDGYYLINPGEVAYIKTKHASGSGIYAVLKTEKAGKYRVSVSYRVSGIRWESRYRLYLNETAELRGYVVIRNPTGAEFSGTNVLLVAGDVNLGQHAQTPVPYTKADGVVVSSPEKVEAFYLYRLGIVDVKAESTMVYPYVTLEVPFEREYLYESWAYSGEGPVYESVSFKTDKVLPAGTVEVYKKTGEGILLIGETRIDHTPKGGVVRVGIGRDYDVRGITTVLERSDDGKHYRIRITLQNFGSETKTIIVRHHKWGKVTYSSVQPVDETADYVEFMVTIEPGEKEEITFEYGR